MEEFFASLYNETHWMDVVKAYKSEYEEIDLESKNELLKLEIPNDIKIVLVCKLGSHISKWINSDIPALGDKKPIDYLKTDKGVKALKAAIMRMPD